MTPDAILANLRAMLHNDEDKIMPAEDLFHKGDFRVGKSPEPYTKWTDILQVNFAWIYSVLRSLTAVTG